MSDISLKKLENIFTKIAGEDKIIDREEFKNALEIRDINIANRLFDIFDSDKSGTLELNEFLTTVKFLQNADENQKLKFAFDLYDFDNSGTIEKNELNKLIQSGLNENNLSFSQDQVEDLCQILFSEVDTDNSGEISFKEFKEVAKKYPDLLTGMTVSPVNWLKPKEKKNTKNKESNFKQIQSKINEIFYKFEVKDLIFYFIYFSINIFIFIKTVNSYQHTNINTNLQIAIGFGALLNFNGAIILLPILRHFITKIRKTVFFNYLPLDDAVLFHRIVGHLMFFSAILHIYFLIQYFTILNKPIYYYLFSTFPGITGIILSIIFINMWITALPSIRKGGYFKLFYLSHYGYILWLIFLIIHSPEFYKWLLIPGSFFIFERILRSFSLVQRTTVYDVQLLPSNVLGFYLNKPNNFKFQAGDYFYIKCPNISNYEWHPFTISSAPEEENLISCHIRSVGSWTGNLYNYYKEFRNKKLEDRKIDIPVLIDGPYGSPSDKVFDSEIAILIGTGIGVTPYSSILKSLLYKIYTEKSGKHPNKIYFYWQNRGQHSFEWFLDLLAEIEEKDVNRQFNLNIFLTGTQSQKDMKSNMLYIAMDMKHKKNKVDLITGLKIKTNFGRPNCNKIFKEISDEISGKKVDVFFCGHPKVGKSVEKSSKLFKFQYHQENF